MKRLICTLMIICLLLFSGCANKEVIEETLVFGKVINKNSCWNAGTKTTHYEISIKYDNIEKKFDNYRLYNIVNVGDNIQVIYSKYKVTDDNVSNIYHSIYLP